MKSSRYTFISTFGVAACILARPLANVSEWSLQLVYGTTYATIAAGSLLALFFGDTKVHDPAFAWSRIWSVTYVVFLSILLTSEILFDVDLDILFQGFATLSLPVLIYLIAIRSAPEARHRAIFFAIGPLLAVNAIISIIYFFFDFTFWGMVKHHVYTDLIYTNAAVDRRAIGLFASPQSHALSMVVLLVIAVSGWQMKRWLALAFGVLAMTAGILSGSKAFLLGVVLVACIRLPRSIVIMGLVPLLVAGWFTADLLYYSDFRALSLFDAAKNLDQYSATPLWLEALRSVSNFEYILTGQGLGAMGSQSESFKPAMIAFSSTESYILQIVYETGIIGLLLISAMVVSALRRIASNFEPTISPALFLSIIVNAIFTPALYGFGNAALIGLLLAHTRRRK